MKSILIYSGKGGVGKTTTTANLARVLSTKHKVFVLDADVNTPSMNTIFPDPEPNENLMIESLGYQTEKMIYIENPMVRKYIREAIAKIKEFNPEFVLIDTPPSITDVHINLIDTIKVSGLIMVTQPNDLSVADVNRTSFFFKNKQIDTIGIVENMSEGQDLTYTWKKLGTIGFIPGFEQEDIFKKHRAEYEKIAEVLDDIDAVVLENKKRMLTDETIDESALRFVNGKEIEFINVRTAGLRPRQDSRNRIFRSGNGGPATEHVRLGQDKAAARRVRVRGRGVLHGDQRAQHRDTFDHR